MRLAHRVERELWVAIIIENLMFQGKAGAKHSLEQNARISSLPLTASYSVSLPRFDNLRDVSDNTQTMSGLPGVPKDTASQTI